MSRIGEGLLYDACKAAEPTEICIVGGVLSGLCGDCAAGHLNLDSIVSQLNESQRRNDEQRIKN